MSVFAFIWTSTANRPGLTYEQLLPGDAFSHVVDGLEEDKKYTISIYAIYSEGPSEPVSLVGKTCMFFFWIFMLNLLELKTDFMLLIV